MRQMHWAALAAMAALGFGCGSPPRGGNVTQGEQCVGDACATIVITTTRLRARVCADAYNADWSYCNTYEPGIWDIRVPAPDTYAISAQYRDGEFVGEEVSVEPGGRYEVNCRHPDDTPVEKRMVRIEAQGSPPGAMLKDGETLTAVQVGGSYELTLDSRFHEMTLVDPADAYAHTIEGVDTSDAATVPDALAFVGILNVAGRVCTETRGPQVGWVSRPLVIRQVGHEMHVQGLDVMDSIPTIGTAIDSVDGDYHVVGTISMTEIRYEVIGMLDGSTTGPIEYACE